MIFFWSKSPSSLWTETKSWGTVPGAFTVRMKSYGISTKKKILRHGTMAIRCCLIKYLIFIWFRKLQGRIHYYLYQNFNFWYSELFTFSIINKCDVRTFRRFAKWKTSVGLLLTNQCGPASPAGYCSTAIILLAIFVHQNTSCYWPKKNTSCYIFSWVFLSTHTYFSIYTYLMQN